MSSRLTMILAGLFLLAALLAGYWGLMLSRPAEPVAAPPVVETSAPPVPGIAPGNTICRCQPPTKNSAVVRDNAASSDPRPRATSWDIRASVMAM